VLGQLCNCEAGVKTSGETQKLPAHVVANRVEWCDMPYLTELLCEGSRVVVSLMCMMIAGYGSDIEGLGG
jgi:hypothetical protein